MIKKHLLIALCILPQILFGATRIETNLQKKTNSKTMTQWVDSVFNQMSLDQRIGQTITIMAAGTNTPVARKKLTDLVKNQHIGGILFSKGTPDDQVALTNECIAAAKVPLLISLDGEWGLSMRLKETTRFPRNMTLGAIQEDSLIYRYGHEVARQCRRMGIHVNFAPSLDVNSNSANPVIGTRSFGENPERVAKLGVLYSKGLEDGGVMAVAKHFPGHGDTSTDSHKTLPVIQHDRKRLDKVEFYPFREYINKGLSGMMSAHLNIPALDASGAPSSLSKLIVTDLLQNEFGFDGLIFTDGLAMKGVSAETDMSIRALLAGNHILLGPIYPEREYEAIRKGVAEGKISEEAINAICKKILAYKYILQVENKQIATRNLSSDLNTPYAEWLARILNQKAITLVKNDDHTIPLKHLEKKKIAAIAIGGSPREFHRTLKLYGDVTTFSVANSAELTQLKSKLAPYNTVIISIHDNKNYQSNVVQSICADKNSILVFFTSPYKMANYKGAIQKTEAVVVGYENTPFAQEYAAQAIFGGNEIEGKLPVSVKGLYEEGEGIKTEKTRLSYNVPESVGIRSSKLNGIAKIVQEGISEKAYPGCQVLIAKDGVIIYNEAFGSFQYDKKRAVNDSDIYDIASMTKATATLPAVMKIYDDKKIGLQNPLSKFVPALKNTNKDKITIREALLHETGITSFIPYYMPAIDVSSYAGNLFNARETGLYSAEFDNNTWARTDYKYKSNLISTTKKAGFELQIADNLYVSAAFKDTIIQNIANSKLRASKGYLYSCLNFMLLKEVVEDVSKTDLNTFVQTNFFERLGSTTTTYNPLTKFSKDRIAPTENDKFLRKQLLQGYAHDEGAAFMGGISGNAGLFSNANDLAKLYQMWLNMGNYGGEQYLDKETCRTFTISKSASSRRGLGFDKPDPRNNKGNPCSPQTPLSTYGHTGFTGTCFWIDPDNKLIYIFLSNRVSPSRTHKKLMSLNIRTRIQEEIYNALKK